MFKNIVESFEVGDLINVLIPELRIDEFQSKLGTNDKNIVVAIPLNDKTAASDLVEFLEVGFEFILDADISASEVEPQTYLVFFELLRRSTAPKQLCKIIDDLSASCNYKRKNWKFTYMKDPTEYDLSSLSSIIPLSPKEYRKKFQLPIDKLKNAAGINTIANESFDPLIISIQHAAGLK